jgi:hypothetical protein
MLILTQTTDTLQVKLSGTVTTAQAQCFVGYRNTTSSSITPLRTVTNTNNTTSVTLVSSPSASNQRVVDYLSIYNADTAAVTPTILFNDNGTVYELFSASIQPGEKIEYQEGNGFSVISLNGGVKQATEYGVQTTTVPWTTVVLSADVTNSNAVASTMEDVTGLSFSAAIGTYWFKLEAVGRISAAGRAGAYGFNGPTTSAFGFFGYAFSTSSVLNGGNPYASSQYNATSGATVGPSWATSTGFLITNYVVEGFATFTASGTFQVRHTCTAAGGSFISLAGSILQYYKVL